METVNEYIAFVQQTEEGKKYWGVDDYKLTTYNPFNKESDVDNDHKRIISRITNFFIEYYDRGILFTDDVNFKFIKDAGLTELEAFSLLAYTGDSRVFHEFSDDNVYESISKLISILDSALEKLPSYDCDLLYRMTLSDIDKYKDYYKRKIGQNVFIKGFFSTSKYDFNNSSLVCVIRPLKQNSNARDIENIADKDKRAEREVIFKRNTEFLVERIEKRIEENKDKTYVYMSEC